MQNQNNLIEPQLVYGYHSQKPNPPQMMLIQQKQEYYNLKVEIDRLNILQSNYTQEVERLNNILKMKCEESEGWMFRAQHLETHIQGLQTFENRSRELEKIKIENNDLKFKRESDERVKRSSLQDNKNLQHELGRLDQLLQEKDAEIEDLRSKCSQVELQRLDVQNLQNELIRLDELLQFRDKQIEDINKRASKYDNQRDEIQRLTVSNETMLRERHELNKSNQKLMAEISSLRIIQESYKQAQYDIERYQKIEMDLQYNLEMQQKQITKYEKQVNILVELEQKYEQMQQEKEQLRSMLDSREKDIKQINKTISERDDKVMESVHIQKEYELQITTITNENKNLIKESKEILRQKKNTDKEMEQVKSKLSKTEIIINDLKEEMHHYKFDKQLLNKRENELAKFVEKYKLMEADFEQQALTHKQLKEQIKYVKDECQRLNKQNKQLEQENQKLTNKLSINANIAKAMDDAILKIVLMSIEIDSLRSQVDNKVEEVKSIRRQSLNFDLTKTSQQKSQTKSRTERDSIFRSQTQPISNQIESEKESDDSSSQD